jgi:hypothetical protein
VKVVSARKPIHKLVKITRRFKVILLHEVTSIGNARASTRTIGA